MLADNICMARSGSAADSQIVADYVANHLASHQLELMDVVPLLLLLVSWEKSIKVPVKSAANVMKRIAYTNKDALSLGAIVGGYDKYEKGST